MQNKILVHANAFTSKEIANALALKKAENVDVSVIIDQSQRIHKDAVVGMHTMQTASIPIQDGSANNLTHNKVMIFDDEIVATGSYNFTSSAEVRNSENLLVVRSSDLAKKYTDNWHKNLNKQFYKEPKKALKLAPLEENQMHVCFAPYEDCEQALVDFIGATNGELKVQAYSLKSPPIKDALINLKKRGKKVQVVMDEGKMKGIARAGAAVDQGSLTTAKALQAGGIDMYPGKLRVLSAGAGTDPGLSHNKIMIQDGHTVATGSYNFTDESKDNAENLLFIRSQDLAGEYLTNWAKDSGGTNLFLLSKAIEDVDAVSVDIPTTWAVRRASFSGIEVEGEKISLSYPVYIKLNKDNSGVGLLKLKTSWIGVSSNSKFVGVAHNGWFTEVQSGEVDDQKWKGNQSNFTFGWDSPLGISCFAQLQLRTIEDDFLDKREDQDTLIGLGSEFESKNHGLFKVKTDLKVRVGFSKRSLEDVFVTKPVVLFNLKNKFQADIVECGVGVDVGAGRSSNIQMDLNFSL